MNDSSENLGAHAARVRGPTWQLCHRSSARGPRAPPGVFIVPGRRSLRHSRRLQNSSIRIFLSYIFLSAKPQTRKCMTGKYGWMTNHQGDNLWDLPPATPYLPTRSFVMRSLIALTSSGLMALFCNSNLNLSSLDVVICSTYGDFRSKLLIDLRSHRYVYSASLLALNAITLSRISSLPSMSRLKPRFSVAQNVFVGVLRVVLRIREALYSHAAIDSQFPGTK